MEEPQERAPIAAHDDVIASANVPEVGPARRSALGALAAPIQVLTVE
jgi:hypothetical protein